MVITVRRLLVFLLLLVGCSGGSDPRVEAFDSGSYRPVSVGGYEISGKREGATTRAVAVLTLAGGGRLRLELIVGYNPTPELESGRWNLEAGRKDGRKAGGEIRAKSLKFLGGQGGEASLGGRFLLEEDGAPRYRVTLPTRRIDEGGWKLE
jgi:hypothetical protein